MKESEYNNAARLARIRVAQTIIGSIVPDEIITKEELRVVGNWLEAMADKLAEQIHVEE